MKDFAAPVQQFDSFELEVSQLITELMEAFANVDGASDTAKSKQALTQFRKRVIRIGLIAGRFGLDGLHDVCVEFQKIIQNLQDRATELKKHERELLEEWPMLVMCYANSPGDSTSVDALLAYIQRPEWEFPLAEAEINNIRQLMSSKLDSEAVSVEEGGADKTQASSGTIEPGDEAAAEGCSAADLGTVESLRLEVKEAMDECLKDLQLNGDDATTISVSETLSNCAARIELLGMSTAMAGFMGLMDTCLLFHEGLKKLATNDEVLDQTTLDALDKWAPLVSEYLSDPNNPALSKALIDYLQSIHWTMLLSDDDARNLSELLHPEEIQLNELPPEPEDSGSYQVEVQECAQQEVNDTTEISLPELPSEEQNECRERIEIPRAYLELLELLTTELEASRDTLDLALADASDPEIDVKSRKTAFEKYINQLQRFEEASLTLGLEGLSQVFSHITENSHRFIKQERALAGEERQLYSEWFDKVQCYLGEPFNARICEALADYLTDVKWTTPLSSTGKTELCMRLSSPEFELAEEEVEPRQTVATPEDISLELPAEVNASLLDSLLQELPGYTEEFTQAVMRIARGNGNPADVDSAQRIAHTIKGSANTVGVVGLATLTHHVEDILQAFSKAKRVPGKQLSDLLLNAADVLEAMSEKLLGIGPAPDQSLAVLQEILDWANRIDANGIPEDDMQDESPAPALSVASTGDNKASESITSETDEVQKVTPTLRVPASLIDELLRLVGESLILTGQLGERLKNAEQDTVVLRQHNTVLQQLTYDLEQVVDVQGVTASRRRDSAYEELDSLELDQYNELHTITRQLVEAATDSKEMTQELEEKLVSFDGLLATQKRLNNETQEVVIETRMVPVSNIVPRLQRAVRQTCRLAGKDVDLHISGAETMMDSDVLSDLTEPLMHILRNAVDHGMEKPDRRKHLGKGQTGNIQLEFSRQGDNIVVRCQDDGGGFDYEQIRQRAIEMELITGEGLVTDEELSRLILMPGFSTRNEATQVSGRGMGMDVVQSKVGQMKGSIKLESVRNQGCVIELRLPITLISIHGLLIQVGMQTIAVSSRGVERITHGDDGEFHYEGDNLIYTLEEEQHDAIELEALIGVATSASTTTPNEKAVLLVKNDAGKITAVRVGVVSASVELVVKQLGPYVPSLSGVEGATILGDGSIAPVMDLVDLLMAEDVTNQTRFNINDVDTLSASLPRALVVDDSLSARRSLAEFVEDIGFTVCTARDGMEAIDVMRDQAPDILLVDLEMPRMNGLELASHLRSVGDSKDIPIIMITSRSTEKHRRLAESAGVNIYLTKPFSETELLGHMQEQLSQSVRHNLET